MLVVGAGPWATRCSRTWPCWASGRRTSSTSTTVEPSNLSRSVLFRAEDGGQPKAEVAARARRRDQPRGRDSSPIHGDVITDLGLGLFADVDVVIGCLDNREARLWVNRQCWKVGTPWVDAGIQEIQGVVKVFVPPDSACYECAMTERDYQLLNLRYSCPLLRRDQILEGKVPTAPTIASMMAALEVQEALKLIHGLPVAAGSALVFNGVANQFYTTQLPLPRRLPEPRDLPASRRSLPLGTADTPAALFAGGARRVLQRPLTWRSSATWWSRSTARAAAGTSRSSGRRTWVARPRPTARTAASRRGPRSSARSSDGSPLAARSLADSASRRTISCGSTATTDSGFFLLAGDRDSHELEECARGSHGAEP